MLIGINIIIIINKQNYEFARVDVLLLLLWSDNNIIHSMIIIQSRTPFIVVHPAQKNIKIGG